MHALHVETVGADRAFLAPFWHTERAFRPWTDDKSIEFVNESMSPILTPPFFFSTSNSRTNRDTGFRA
jgi:heme-degrading monooxygenase HmoA